MTLPAAPRLTSVVRSALSDFYFNSGRLVPVNVLWGAGVVLVILVGLIWPFGAFLLAPFLAFPTAGIFRVAARIVRNDGDVSFRDALTAYRDYAIPTLLIGGAYVIGILVLGTNLVVGLTQTEPVGWVVGTFAAWGLCVLWCGASVVWPLLVDPRLAERPARERMRLAGLVILAYPGRIALLGAVVALITAISTILTAAILTISVAFVALVSCRYVYPAAERLERQLGIGR